MTDNKEALEALSELEGMYTDIEIIRKTLIEQQEQLNEYKMVADSLDDMFWREHKKVAELEIDLENWKDAAHRQMERQPIHIIDPRQSEIITELTAALEFVYDEMGIMAEPIINKALQKAKEMG